MNNRILPEFQNFLLSRSLVPEKNVSFYAHWVSKFLAFSNRNENGYDMRIVPELLGHTNLQTTMIYTYVTKKNILGGKSPLDK